MAVEMIFGGLYSLFATIIGPTARRYTPFLGSLFVFILCNNLFGLIPLGHSSTSSFANTTFALGMMTFLYVQGIALKENGIGGYLHHMAGSPKTGMDWGFSLLLFPLHLLGELIKPISLSLRLFGNIFGEDTLVATMVLLGAGISFSLSGQSPGCRDCRCSSRSISWACCRAPSRRWCSRCWRRFTSPCGCPTGTTVTSTAKATTPTRRGPRP